MPGGAGHRLLLVYAPPAPHRGENIARAVDLLKCPRGERSRKWPAEGRANPTTSHNKGGPYAGPP